MTKGAEERFEPGLEFVIPRNRGAHDNLLRTTLQDETLQASPGSSYLPK
jgi:hypothetical protein